MRIWKSEEDFSEEERLLRQDVPGGEPGGGPEIIREEHPPGKAPARRRGGASEPLVLSDEVRNEIEMALPATRSAADRLAQAAEAYRRDRFPEALRLLVALRREVRSPAVEELYGLTFYRLGRWKDAARKLTRVGVDTGSIDQLPVVMDCYRALGKHAKVQEIYEELRRESPGAELLAEAKIVLAQSIADAGDLDGAIAVLARAGRRVAHPRIYHVRQWYVLGDLNERSGDLAKASAYFRMVLDSGEEPYDAEERLVALS